jgi:hypothetical protein
MKKEVQDEWTEKNSPADKTIYGANNSPWGSSFLQLEPLSFNSNKYILCCPIERSGLSYWSKGKAVVSDIDIARS